MNSASSIQNLGSCIRLGNIAYARSGDKGSGANVALFARSAKDYDFLKDHVTARMVENYFKPLEVGKVRRFEVPNLHAFNFILPKILAGGGSRSLRIDAQGKTLGQAILEITLKRSAKKTRKTERIATKMRKIHRKTS